MSPKKYLILAKKETNQFTDSVPTAAANAILVKNLRATPLQVENEDRALDRPYYGISEQVAVSQEARVEFDVEIAGSGDAGTAPGWGLLLRACAFAEDITADTSVAYNPISDTFEYVTIYCYLDGILMKLLGAAGNVTFNFAAKKLPFMHYSFIGQYADVSDATVPTDASFTIFKTPRPSLPTWTGDLTVGTYAAKVADFNFDMANEVNHAIWMNQESLSVNDRKPKGKITVEGVTVATKDYWQELLESTQQAFSLVHGTEAGNIVTVAAPKMAFSDIGLDAFSGQRTFPISFTLNPDAGNDEVVITCT